MLISSFRPLSFIEQAHKAISQIHMVIANDKTYHPQSSLDTLDTLHNLVSAFFQKLTPVSILKIHKMECKQETFGAELPKIPKENQEAYLILSKCIHFLNNLHSIEPEIYKEINKKHLENVKAHLTLLIECYYHKEFYTTNELAQTTVRRPGF